MTRDYRYALKAWFAASGVYYWDIGGVILLRTFPFLDGDELLSQGEDAHFEAAKSLAGDDYVGRPIAGRIYRVPDHVRAARTYEHRGCVFMYAVVTGRSAPPEPISRTILPLGKAVPDLFIFVAMIVVVPVVAGAVIGCERRRRDHDPDYRRVAKGAWVGFKIGGAALVLLVAYVFGHLPPVPI